MKQFKPPTNTHTEINITPLIDIIFILLVFFMVSASFIKPSIKIKLPVAASTEKNKNDKMSVYLDKDLSLFLNKDLLAIDQMQQKIADEVAQNPDLVVMFFCDQSVVFKNVVKVIDALKLAGVKNVAISHALTQ
ncbi:MAG: ExbD/TolR family protein [Spirochaetia bacterium]